MHFSYLMLRYQAAAFAVGISIASLNMNAMQQVGSMKIAGYLAIVMPGPIQSDEAREAQRV